MRVVSALSRPHGTLAEKAKGPAGTGQYVSVTLSRVRGRGDGGRRVLQRKELFVHAFRVSTDVVVKRVAITKPVRWHPGPGKETYRDCRQHCA